MKKAAGKKKARKKVARKKAARRKSTARKPRAGARRASKKSSKKATARKGARKKTKKPKPRRDTVHLVPPAGPDHVPELSQSRKDKVRWKNDDAIDHTLIFTLWPFTGSNKSIVVKAGKFSKKWYTVSPTVVQRTYSYAISPPFTSQGPPDPPQVEVGP